MAFQNTFKHKAHWHFFYHLLWSVYISFLKICLRQREAIQEYKELVRREKNITSR